MVTLKTKTQSKKYPRISDTSWKTIKYSDITVFYLHELDGGALDFGEEAFVNTVRELYGSVDNLCEFCCGPGFIGFSLLARGLCKKLSLVDINPDAIACCKKTITENSLKDRVTIHLSDGLSAVGNLEVWDLVISNPPHFDGTRKMYENDIIAIDPDWIIHDKFYRDVPRHLSKKGQVLFLENVTGAPEDMWKRMIEKNGLKFIKTFWEKQPTQKYVKRTFNIISLLSWGSIKRFIATCIKQKNTNFLFRRVYPYYFVQAKK